MKNCNYIGLKFKIADKILIINKYILLIFSERRENAANIGHIFDRKVFLTGLLLKIEPAFTAKDAELLSMLKKKLSSIAELDRIIMNILAERKEDAAGKISTLKKISAAVKAYGLNNNASD
ncbi:MAG: hypothetical protein ACYCSQ_04565 [bacterium]